MNFKQILLIIFLFLSVFSNAQFFTDLSFGYGFSGPGSDSHDNYVNVEYKYDYDNQKYLLSDLEIIEANASKGLLFTNEIGYLFKNKFSFSMLSVYQNNYFTKTEMANTSSQLLNQENDIVNSTSITKSIYYNNLLSFTPQLSLHMNIKKFSYIVSLGYTLAFAKIFRSEELEVSSNDTFGEFKGNSINHRQYFSKAIHSLTLSNKIMYSLTSRWSAFLMVAVTPIMFRTEKIIQNYNFHENSQNSFPIDDTEEKEITPNRDSDFYALNLNISLGIRYYFIKKEN